jgi:hypothetical protein
MRSNVEQANIFDAVNMTSNSTQPAQLSFGAGGAVMPALKPTPGIILLNLSAAGTLTLPPITVAAGNVGQRMEGRSIKFYNVSTGAFTATLAPAAGDPAIIGTATVAQNAVAVATVVNGVWRMG